MQAKPRDGLQGMGVGGAHRREEQLVKKPKKKPNTELSKAQTCQKENDCPEQADLLCAHTSIWKMESTGIEFGAKGTLSFKLCAGIWVSPPSVTCFRFPTRSCSCSLATAKILPLTNLDKGFPGDSAVESTCQCRKHRRPGFDPWVRKIAWRRAWQAWRIPVDRGAWWAAVHGVTKSWTRLKWVSRHACNLGKKKRVKFCIFYSYY